MLSIQPFLDENFDDQRLYGNPASDVVIRCPFCSRRYGTPDDKGKLYVSIKKQVVHCFRCDYSATWVGFVCDYIGCDYLLAYKELYVRPNPKQFSDLPDLLFRRKDKELSESFRKISLPHDFVELISQENFRLVKVARAYAKKRGFGRSYWKRYNLGVAESVGWRIVIPIEDDYWQARGMMDWIEPKYINPEVQSTHYIFNSFALKWYDEVVVTEGAFSAMAVGENAIALVGKTLPPEKMERLVQSDVERFIITVEPNAFRSMMKLADRLVGVGKVVTLWNYDSGDPADGSSHTEHLYNFKTKLSFLIGK